MKKLTIVFAILTCVQLLNAQSKKVDSFNSVDISGSISAELIESNEERVEYHITKGDEKNLIIMNKGNNLIVKIDGSWNKKQTSAKVKIYYKSINDLEVSSGSSVKVKSIVEADKFDLEVSSGSTCTLGLESEFLDLEVSSGSTLNLSGAGSIADIEVSSGSSFRGMDYSVRKADLEVSSGSTAQLEVTRSLVGDVSSGSTLRYSGEPSTLDVDKDISSSVSKR